MSRVESLGYLCIEASDLDAWERFATEFIGLVLSERRADGSLVLRMDDHQLRYLVTPGPLDDLAAAGWQVASHEALDLLTERLEAAGYSTAQADAETCRSRCVEAIRRVEDPNGLPIELFVGPAQADDTFSSEVAKGGFVTGNLGMGHIVLRATNLEQTKRFYTELLGLRISDVVTGEVGPGMEIAVVFLHANPRHHSVAFSAVPSPKRIDHFLVEYKDFEGVGLAYDRAVAGTTPITQTSVSTPTIGWSRSTH